VALPGADFDARPGTHLAQRLARQPAVVGQAANLEVNPVLDLVRVAPVHQALDQSDHLWDVLGGLGGDMRAQDVERVGVLEEEPGEALGDLPGVATRPPRTDQHAVLALVGVRGRVKRGSVTRFGRVSLHGGKSATE